MEADHQLPIGGEIFLDHVAHFVPDVTKLIAGDTEKWRKVICGWTSDRGSATRRRIATDARPSCEVQASTVSRLLHGAAGRFA